MLIKINPKVEEAVRMHRPVVALESTIISHGMPYPQNVQTAMQVEKIITDLGVVPATVGIIAGVPTVGMTADEIEQFGSRKGVAKVSRRDIPVVMAKKMWGATTVASTMVFAAMAGIEVFVTGGVGGVHRHAQQTFDISADLQELAHTNVTVVCAGAKAILDLPLTLEYLETMGVPVLGYKSSQLAAFYTSDSGLKLDYEMKDAHEVAEVIYYKRQMHLDGGLLISNPIPKQFEMPKAVIDGYIDKALKEMDAQGVKGKDCTPFLLARIASLTGGDSLASNIQLVYNNAKVGSAIATELSRLGQD